MSEQDLEYFMKRERDERESAERAADVAARCVHLTLAERYAERVRNMAPLNAARRRA